MPAMVEYGLDWRSRNDANRLSAAQALAGANATMISATGSIIANALPTRAQSLKDFLVFSTLAARPFASGGPLTGFGWRVVNWAVLRPVALACLGLVGLRRGAARSG